MMKQTAVNLHMLRIVEANRIERVLLIHKEFIESGQVRTADLAERFNVSSVTIQKDLRAIQRVIPIYYDNYHWILDDSTISLY